MKTVWFKYCKSPGEKEDLKKTLLNSSVSFSRLREILEEELKELDRKEITPDYTSPSWSHQQAHRNGYRQHLQQTIDLLTFEKE